MYEESGAVDYTMEPLCDYEFGGANGMAFRADIRKLALIPPESEMAEVREFEELPENLTYPAITSVLFELMKVHH